MTTERSSREIPTFHKGLYPAYRAEAMRQVARKMKLPFGILAKPGKNYSPGNVVPDGMAYIRLDVKNKRALFWERVDAIAPPPTHEEIASGAYMR